MTSTNISSNPAETPQSELDATSFVSKRPDGVYVNLRRLLIPSDFELFVNRLFTGGGRFAGLDYATFLKLLYDGEWLKAEREKTAELKIANEVVRFLPQRQSLYRPVKVLEGGKRAEYVFEPITVEIAYDEPVYGEPNEEGVAPVVSHVRKVREEPGRLDFDEFVADMWMKGVRFGIETETVRKMIACGDTARLPVARYLEPTAGSDAEILEVCPGLRRDNSPKILANGKADLSVFANRFPQVAKGARLLKKVPRKLGKQGWLVSGEVIEPAMPKDLDMDVLASAGTRVERVADGEYIVATLDGFLTLDTKSNSVSVTEKIESKAGISVKTTGNLALDVDEFIEHGEVQEGRVVKGKHMTFRSDVFGSILSQDGNIRIDGNLSGGRAETHGGDVTLGARASRAVIRAPNGKVLVKYCENCSIVGKVVRIEHAVNCEIVADELYAELIEGSMVAGKSVKLLSSGERRGTESLVTMLIPDLSGFEQSISKLKNEIAAAMESHASKMREIEVVKSEPEFAKYLALADRIKSGAIKLTADQAVNWRKLMEKNAKATNQVAKLDAEIAALDSALKASEEELSYVERDRDAAGGNIGCSIEKVVGHTTGQTMRSSTGVGVFSTMSGSDIRALLQKADSHKARIFSTDSGAINWKFR